MPTTELQHQEDPQGAFATILKEASEAYTLEHPNASLALTVLERVTLRFQYLTSIGVVASFTITTCPDAFAVHAVSPRGVRLTLSWDAQWIKRSNAISKDEGLPTIDVPLMPQS